MRKIALDIGDVRIGIATSDPMGIIASGYSTFQRTGDYEKDLRFLVDTARQNNCDTIVLGLPVNMDGTEGERARITRQFGEDLKTLTDVKIVYQDERWTTVSAEKALIESGMRREKRKNVVDKVAATIILQSYLNRF
ncbi:MAG TPA: Holliday junction resolvase RuvX [Clostridia bacterium]|mgnify:CR=1 FL=1|nr:Holliday junction resolvase RuvX [Clostridia bacterium]